MCLEGGAHNRPGRFLEQESLLFHKGQKIFWSSKTPIPRQPLGPPSPLFSVFFSGGEAAGA